MPLFKPAVMSNKGLTWWQAMRGQKALGTWEITSDDIHLKNAGFQVPQQRELAEQASSARRVLLGPVISPYLIPHSGDWNLSAPTTAAFSTTHLQSAHEHKTLKHEVMAYESWTMWYLCFHGDGFGCVVHMYVKCNWKTAVIREGLRDGWE